MQNVRAIEAKRAEAVSCPRCLSPRVLESRRNPVEDVIYHSLGFLPCRCTACMQRFKAFAGPAWLRALFGRRLNHTA